jgi:hypothetical protein
VRGYPGGEVDTTLTGLLIAAPAVLAGVLVAVTRQGRHREAAGQRLAPRDVGLSAFPRGGVLVQVASPGSPAARTSLNRLARAIAETSPEALVIEYPPARAPAPLRTLGTPVVVHVDASGAVTRTWPAPPPSGEVRALLTRSPRYEPAVAGSR